MKKLLKALWAHDVTHLLVTIPAAAVVIVGIWLASSVGIAPRAMAQIPQLSVPSPLNVMDLVAYGGGPASFQVSTQPVMRAGIQEFGFCSGGGTTATLNTAQTVFTPCEYSPQLKSTATGIVLTTVSTSNVATIDVMWSDGSTATATAPGAVGNAITFTTGGKTTGIAGFTLVVASSASLAANTAYTYQGTYTTQGN